MSAIARGYALKPATSKYFDLPFTTETFVDMFRMAAGLRAKTVAHAVGVSLDPVLWGYDGGRSPDAVPGALDWWFELEVTAPLRR